jgi:hypothetical protein
MLVIASSAATGVGSRVVAASARRVVVATAREERRCSIMFGWVVALEAGGVVV